MFASTGPHYCPHCPPVYVGKKMDRRCGERLVVERENYSGTGVDIARCETCKKAFEISYKVDKIEEIKR